MGKKVKLLSGVELEISLAPIDDGLDLLEIFTAEFRQVQIKADQTNPMFYKEVLGVLIPSKPFKAAIWKCFDRVLYGGKRITKETFESEEGRADYLQILKEVAWENLRPFGKNLYAEFAPLLQEILKGLP